MYGHTYILEHGLRVERCRTLDLFSHEGQELAAEVCENILTLPVMHSKHADELRHIRISYNNVQVGYAVNPQAVRFDLKGMAEEMQYLLKKEITAR